MTQTAPDFVFGRLFIVAEMANAHEGKLEEAKRIVDAAAGAGADAIKFQAFTAEELVVSDHPQYDLFHGLEMPPASWRELVEYARGRNLQVFSDVFGLESAEMMIGLGVDGLKIHAADVGNDRLLQRVASTGKPILLSAGGSTWIETAEAVRVLKDNGADTIILMHGVQNYPTHLTDTFLRRIHDLRSRFQLPIGFASHPDGGDPLALEIPLWAAAAGAEVLEIHLTLDRSREGLDYYSSLNPDVFSTVVGRLRDMEPTIGPKSPRLTENELRYRAGHKKQLVALKDIRRGEALTDHNVALKRVDPKHGGFPIGLRENLGKKAARDIPAHSPIQRKDLQMKVVATLACRLASTRLYGKPMQLVGGRPIIQNLIDRLRQVRALDEVCLAITEGPDRHVFVDYAERNNLPYVIGSEKDVLGRLIAAADHCHADIALRCTTENPYIYWENVDELIRSHIENNAALTVTEKLPVGAVVEVISVSALKKAHQHGEDRHRSELCTLFIAENPDVFKIQRVHPPDKLRRPDLRLTVDTPEDLMVVRKLYEDLKGDTHLITIDEIVDYLNDHPEVVALNSKYQVLNLWK